MDCLTKTNRHLTWPQLVLDSLSVKIRQQIPACLEQSLLEQLASQIHLEIPQPQALVLAVCLDQLRTHHLSASLSNQPHRALASARHHLQGQALVSKQEKWVMNL